MKISQRITALILVLVVAFATPGCGLKDWCQTYQTGFSYVEQYAFTVLDPASDLKPEWKDKYLKSKATLLSVNDVISNTCNSYKNGEPIDRDKANEIISQGTLAVFEIIELYQLFTNGNVATRDIRGANIDLEKLKADLMKVHNEASKSR